MNETLSQKIQQRIDSAQLTPLPRWRFLLLRGSIWVLALLSVMVGSIAVSAIFFLITDFYRHGLLPPFAGPMPMPPPPGPGEFLLMIPFVWIGLLVLFVAVTEWSAARTRTGYRYRARTLVLGSVVLSLVCGVGLNALGVGRAAHERFHRLPLYDSATYDARSAWDRPMLGRLAGHVVSIQDAQHFMLQDFSGRVWKVRFASTTDIEEFEVSSTVRMLGVMDASSSIFMVRTLREWER